MEWFSFNMFYKSWFFIIFEFETSYVFAHLFLIFNKSRRLCNIWFITTTINFACNIVLILIVIVEFYFVRLLIKLLDNLNEIRMLNMELNFRLCSEMPLKRQTFVTGSFLWGRGTYTPELFCFKDLYKSNLIYLAYYKNIIGFWSILSTFIRYKAINVFFKIAFTTRTSMLVKVTFSDTRRQTECILVCSWRKMWS